MPSASAVRGAVDDRVGGEHRAVPVDLVEPQRGPAPVAARGDAVDLVADARDGRAGRGRARRARGRRARARRRPRRRRPGGGSVRPGPATQPGPVTCGSAPSGGRSAPDLRADEEAGERARAGVGARRPAMAAQRGERVHEQQVGVDLGGGRARARLVAAERGRPQRRRAGAAARRRRRGSRRRRARRPRGGGARGVLGGDRREDMGEQRDGARGVAAKAASRRRRPVDGTRIGNLRVGAPRRGLEAEREAPSASRRDGRRAHGS